jgi:hypothetical protein
MTEIEKEPEICAAQNATTRSENTASRPSFASGILNRKPQKPC